jgi:mannose-6-phosphate isomerase-like protein (cupin superfamily)
MRNALVLAITCLVSVQAADPTQPLFWNAGQMKDVDQKAATKLNPERHLGTERLMDSVFVAFRNGSGEAELHENQADLIIVRSGAGAVLVGGKMIGGKPSGAGEVRGASIEGATKYPITAGDTLYVPANTVHQFWMEPGQNFTAMVVKITPKP